MIRFCSWVWMARLPVAGLPVVGPADAADLVAVDASRSYRQPLTTFHGAHVLGLLLQPDDLGAVRVPAELLGDRLERPRVELLDPGDRDRTRRARRGSSIGVDADLARGEHDPRDRRRRRATSTWSPSNSSNDAVRERLDRRAPALVAQARLRREDDQRLAHRARHLATQQVEVLRRGRRLARPGCCPRRPG